MGDLSLLSLLPGPPEIPWIVKAGVFTQLAWLHFQAQAHKIQLHRYALDVFLLQISLEMAVAGENTWEYTLHCASRILPRCVHDSKCHSVILLYICHEALSLLFVCVAEHAMISHPEAAASWRKCLAEVPFTGICWVSVIHTQQGWKNKREPEGETER